MPLLQLVMIVKNGDDTIGRVLDSVKKHIDCWTILDTGSTDSTMSIIREKLANVPGQLHQEPFIDFKTTRNRALELAGTSCKYLIMLDDSYEVKGAAALRKLLNKSDEKALAIRINDDKAITEYYSVRILKSSEGIQYKYRIHEVPDVSNPVYMSEQNISIVDHKTKKQAQRSTDRFEYDMRMLLEEHAENPSDPRIVRYLGIVSMILNKHQEAFGWFKKLLKMQGISDDDRYCALTNSAVLMYKELGGDHDDYIRFMRRATKEVPFRAEPYYRLAIMFRQLGQMENALKCIHTASNIPIPRIIEPFDVSIYKKEIPYLMIEICLQMKIVEQIVPLVKRMLSDYPTEQRFLNIKHAISTPDMTGLRRLEAPTIVFHIHDEEQCNPKNTSRLSERLYLVVKLARRLIDLRFRVAIFSNFGKDECNHEGIDFIHQDYYAEFMQSYYVHALVATSGKYLCLYDNVEKVYLWPFDTYPTEEFIQIHPKKFKGILSISEWQIYNIQKAWNIPLENFTMIPYAVDAVQELTKTPLSFCCEPENETELTNILDLWPSLSAKYPEASLTVINSRVQQRSPVDKITYSGEKNTVLGSSSVWISLHHDRSPYSTKALAAQTAGCLCVATTAGSLVEILGQERGVLLPDYSPETKDKIVEKISEVLDNSNVLSNILDKSSKWSRAHSFNQLAKVWIKLLQ
jgi:tetratricopeptide (TPR) repeat protein